MESFVINKYPDGTSYVTIPKDWTETTQVVTFRVNNYEDLIHLCQLCEVLEYNHVETCIIIPNLIDAQADRRFNSHQSSGLYLISTILNRYENIFFKIYHPHNPAVVEALFDNAECIDNSEFIHIVLSKITTGKESFPILMSPDAGAFKPLISTCNKLEWKGETYSASKARDPLTGKLTQLVDRQDFEGKDILIVDDICVRGGTFKGLSKLLKERNCGKLYLAVSHMTLQNLGDDPVTDYFDEVFTTNSKYDDYYFTDEVTHKLTKENLEIIKMF